MSDARDLAELHVSSFNERAWDRATALYDPNLEMVEPAEPPGGIEPYLWRPARGFVTAFPDSQMTTTAVADPATSSRSRASTPDPHRSAGDPARGGTADRADLVLPLCDMFEIEAGRIVAIRAYYRPDDIRGPTRLIPDSAPPG